MTTNPERPQPTEFQESNNPSSSSLQSECLGMQNLAEFRAACKNTTATELPQLSVVANNATPDKLYPTTDHQQQAANGPIIDRTNNIQHKPPTPDVSPVANERVIDRTNHIQYGSERTNPSPPAPEPKPDRSETIPFQAANNPPKVTEELLELLQSQNTYVPLAPKRVDR